MGEPTDDDLIECVGGPADGVVYRTPARHLRIPAALTPEEAQRMAARSMARNLAWLGLGPEPEDDGPIIRFHVYTDSGRRTAEGRRVFVPEG
jgi:hypothetical protein